MDINTFLAASLALAVVANLLRVLVRKAAAGRAYAQSPAVETLRPAELAYLLRGGDMSNVVAVLAFDVLHRAVKSGSDGEYPTDLAPYERKIWQNARDFVSRWGESKVEQVLPKPGKESLAVTTRKVSVLYRFFSGSARSFLEEVVKDPKRIKRYISFAGVARFVADLVGSGYEQMISGELAADLESRGLLRPVEKSSRYVIVLSCLAFVAAAALVAMVVMVLSGYPWSWAPVFCIAMVVVNAAVVRFCLFLLELLPLYAELRDVIAHINRGGWRLRMIRLLLVVFDVTVGIILTLAVLLLLAVEASLMGQFQWPYMRMSAKVLVFASINMYSVFLLIDDARRLSNCRQPTAAALALVKEEREKLAHRSPVETFGQLLAAGGYNPEFSKLLALYGIETLWLLG